MAVYRYSTYKIRIAPDSHKTQGLRAGDIVRRQYFDRNKVIYSLMCVLETGVDVIEGKDSAYFTAALLDGDEPRNGELLDFARVTHLFDTRRGGALYLTASDDEAPYMDVIDGAGFEQSLCYPVMGEGSADIPDKTKYACFGSGHVTASYKDRDNGAERIFRVARNGIPAETESKWGIRQTLETSVEHPERLLVSFKIRSSETLSGIPVSFGYTNGEKTDAEDTLSATPEWSYRLWVLTVEYPKKYSRSLTLDLTNCLRAENDWLEIADLNIIRLSDVAAAAFSNATKGRVGKISGVTDPVFGLLDGYGAYFQNLYATRNVNIAGTLTAGDENGFSSTFYVGKIHKNVIPDSLSCLFSGGMPVEGNVPVGIGEVKEIKGDCRMAVQSAAWRKERIGKPHCFSIWIKSETTGNIAVYQDEHLVGTWEITEAGVWQRYKTVFLVKPSDAADMTVGLSTPNSMEVTAPQLEAGKNATPYQATDGTLSYTEDYGAWFNKGGIGGTIQNPLLRLNEDGSIASRDGSFVINPDGTGHFASGRFKWTKDTIELRGVTIRWENLDEEMQEQLKPCSVSLTGGTTFRFTDKWDTEGDPGQIDIVATEYNFTGERRVWEYLAAEGIWKDAGSHGTLFTLRADFHGWEGRDVLTLRFTSFIKDKSYTATHTSFKLYDGEASYSVHVESDNGTVFRNGVISTVLRARVYKGGTEITERIPESSFRWTRTSRDTESDTLWNAGRHEGKELPVTEDDVWYKAVFSCEVDIK
jgi:hypothetical protein